MSNDKQRGRREPTLGDLGKLDDAPPAAPPRAPPPSGGSRRPTASPPPSRPSRKQPHRMPSRWRAWLWPALAIVVVVILALAWVNQDQLRKMLPRTQLNTTLMHADKAFAAGHLEGTDGTSAHALYAKVLQDEPDNGRARRGLHKVGEAELARASSAIKARKFDVAQRWLDDAHALLGGGAQVATVGKALHDAQYSAARMRKTLAHAQQALAAGNVAGKDGAAELFHRVLQMDPHNAVARHGLDRAGRTLAAQARSALQNHDLATAAARVDELGKLLPHDGDLPSLRADLAQATQAIKAAVAAHLKQGQADLRQGQFTGDGQHSALAEFEAALALDPDNAQAKAGLQQVAQALVVRANAALDMHATAQAHKLLAEAALLAPHAPGLAAAQARLPAVPTTPAPATSAAASAGGFVHPKLTPRAQAQVKQLLSRAKTAVASGHIMLPPGDSAYDLYRQVLAIDGNNAAALHRLAGLPDHVAGEFDHALAAQQLSQAGEYLATLKALQPAGNTQISTRTQRLAGAWLKQAGADIHRGDTQAARKALAAAAQLHADPAQIKALRARLGAGSAQG